jgi:hypothetical protein
MNATTLLRAPRHQRDAVLAENVERRDPFQTGGPHKHNMPLEFVAGDIDFAIRAGEIEDVRAGQAYVDHCEAADRRARWGHD